MKKIQVIGNITKDADMRDVNGKMVINFTVAVNESYKNAEGTKVEKVAFFKCALWRDRGASTKIAQYLLKGKKVFVEGVPDVETYTNKEGKTIGYIKITVREIELLGGGENTGGQAQSAPAAQPAAPANPASSNDAPTGIYQEGGDDLPF